VIDQERSVGNLASLLCALSFATGLGFGEQMEHGLKTAYIGLQIALVLHLPTEEQEAVFYGALLKDVGCTACSAGLAGFFPDDEQIPRLDFMLVDPSRFSEIASWLAKNVPLDAHLLTRIAKFMLFLSQCGPVIREAMRGHCEVAALFARQLGFPDHVQCALRFQWERWDGKGLAYGLNGSEVPLAARILQPAQMIELMHNLAGPLAARALAREKRGTRFDPQVVDAFLLLAEQADFWRMLGDDVARAEILAMAPPTTAEQVMVNQLEQVCEALGDFIDIKTRETWEHSRKVAEVAARIGKHLGLNGSEQRRLRCAGLVHDLGKVAIPYGILTKEGRRTEHEWEMYRLHPYYTYRILEQVDPLKDLAAAAASHHEWVNGQGYYRQLSGQQIPLHGRILAVANSYVRLLQRQTEKNALNQMRAMVDVQFDEACYHALVMSLKEEQPLAATPAQYRSQNDLTKRETEVLRLLAQGKSTPQIARALVISGKTVEHHLTHIYQKIGVSCRTSAVVYAAQHGII
jgi:HD-GYP domain-containing protein (c-di-GMP phosphodiesterase class II)